MGARRREHNPMADVGATTEHDSLKAYSTDESDGAKGIELLSTVSQERRPIRLRGGGETVGGGGVKHDQSEGGGRRWGF
ncbi:hypothetical protein V6N12_041591 [Hibiscus sabdariffa]|uniref:DUF834 domain-containing protein n=1 Tax=Hibiscus sabdariffa TaxID=183260 RepID=A0ABR2AQ46_9ROSI